jgi:hypothetical protein
MTSICVSTAVWRNAAPQVRERSQPERLALTSGVVQHWTGSQGPFRFSVVNEDGITLCDYRQLEVGATEQPTFYLAIPAGRTFRFQIKDSQGASQGQSRPARCRNGLTAGPVTPVITVGPSDNVHCFERPVAAQV